MKNVTAREFADKIFGTQDLKDISEFKIPLSNAVAMMIEYHELKRNKPMIGFDVNSEKFTKTRDLMFEAWLAAWYEKIPDLTEELDNGECSDKFLKWFNEYSKNV